MENNYNINSLNDIEAPKGIDIKYLASQLDAILENQSKLEDEIVNLKMINPILTKQEVASLLKITVRHVDNLVTRGKLNRYKVGGKTVRFKREEVLKCLDIENGENYDPKSFDY